MTQARTQSIRNRKVLSLFSGMGGLDLGAHIAGLQIAAAVDADQAALASLHRALGAKYICGMTQQLDPDSVLARAGVSDDGHAILIGGPPCTAFSHAGFWLERKRNGSDTQASRIDDYWTYVRVLRPAAFVMENVPGLAFENHRHVLDRLIRRARRAGYRVSSAILNAADYGVPQARRRLFVVGVKGTKPFAFPLPSFVDRHRSAGWAFRGLTNATNPPEDDEKLTGRYAELLPLVPPGDNYLYFTKERGYRFPKFDWRTRYWSFLLKLHPNQPSPTVAATRVHNNGPFHWRSRRLRVRELTRLQTFPDCYPTAAAQDARRHLGNAVPPLLASQILWQLRVTLGDASTMDLPEALQIGLDPNTSANGLSLAFGNAIINPV